MIHFLLKQKYDSSYNVTNRTMLKNQILPGDQNKQIMTIANQNMYTLQMH